MREQRCGCVSEKALYDGGKEHTNGARSEQAANRHRTTTTINAKNNETH